MAANVILEVLIFPEFIQRICALKAWVSAFVLFSRSSFPWFASHVVPAFKTFFLILAPQWWQGATQWLTQPVLFFLVNIVILSIWASTACQADKKAVALRQVTEGKAPSISSVTTEPLNEMIVQTCTRIRSSEASPVSEKMQLFSISNAKDDKVDSSLCCNFQAVGHENFRSRAKLHQIHGVSKETAGKIEPVRTKVFVPQKMEKSTLYSKTISRVHSETSASAAATSAKADSAEAALSFYDKRRSSFPQSSSSVIVRDMSASEGLVEATIIERDELNERIDAFFTRFRQQLQLQREESLSHVGAYSNFP